jgi:hypothetical protein
MNLKNFNEKNLVELKVAIKNYDFVAVETEKGMHTIKAYKNILDTPYFAEEIGVNDTIEEHMHHLDTVHKGGTFDIFAANNEETAIELEIIDELGDAF